MKYKYIYSPCFSSAPAVIDGSMDRAEVTDLYAWMEYQFRIIATNEYGSGEASIPSLKIKTWDSRKKRTLTSTDHCLFFLSLTLTTFLPPQLL